MQTICKHNQTGYCKFGQKCHRHHIDAICKNERSCSKPLCNFRHRNPCKYFNVNGKCKFTNCAYSHKKSESSVKIEQLETEVNNLKDKIFELCNNMSEMMAKLMNLEVNEYHNEWLHEPVATKTKSPYECEQCDYKCNTEIMLRKHTNTKHPVQEMQPKLGTSCQSKCALCDETFTTDHELKHHIEEHWQEIEELDINLLKNGKETFECNICKFRSADDQEVRNHLIEHAQATLITDDHNVLSAKSESKQKEKSYNIMDRYGDDGRPINESSDNGSDDDEDS